MPNSIIVKTAETTRMLRATVLSGLCSVVPVPLLDDYLLKRTRSGLIKGIYRSNKVEPLDRASRKMLYDGPSKGCLVTGVGLVFTVIKKLVKKVFRTLFFFLAIRRASLDMAVTFLLGRTVDRCLKRGLLAGPKGDEAEVLRVREAFQEVVGRTEQDVLARIMRHTWRHVKSPRTLVRRLMKATGRKRRAEDPLEATDLPPDLQDSLDEASNDLEAELQSSQVQGFLKDFDQQFDELLNRKAADTAVTSELPGSE